MGSTVICTLFMRERIFNILNIKVSESKQVFDLLTVQFFIGLANAFMNIVAFTLFIYTFPVTELPIAYLGIALLLVVLNIVYEKIEHKLSPLHLFKVIIGFSILISLVLWLGLSFWNKNVFIFLLLTSATLIYMITGYSFWGLVSLLFNVRESRRVFSVVGAGDIPAKLIGYLFAPLLIPIFGLTNLLWLSLLSLSFGLILFTRTIRKKRWNSVRRKSHEEVVHENNNPEKKDWVSFFFKNKLIFSISLLSVISYNVFVLVDYTFITQVKIRFENIADLATYIATFFALGRFIALIFKLIFTSRVIERLGIISSLFITPITLFFFCLVFFLVGNQSNYNIYIFGVMAMLTEVLRSSMQEPVFFILFQPLKEQLRLKGHMISKGYMLPPSLIIVGLTLFLLHRTGVPITIFLSIKILIVNLILWAFTILFISRTYLKAIHSSIKRNFFSSDEIYIHDDKVFDILLNKIKNGQKREIVYALKLLEKANYPNFDNLLQEQLTNTDVEIKKYVLDELELKGKIDKAALKAILPGEKDTEVKQKIISLLCQSDEEYLKTVAENIGDYEYQIRKTIIISLLNQNEFIYLFKAGNEINKLITSQDAAERELAINIIGELGHIQFTDAVEKLINDDEPSVRRSAVMAACKLKIAKLLPLTLSLSDTSENKYFIIKALLQYGDSLFHDIQSLPPQMLHHHSATFIKIAGKIKGINSINFLLHKLEETSCPAEKIIHALWLKDYEPVSPVEIENLNKLLNKYLTAGLEKTNNYYQVPDFKDEKLMKRSMYNEAKSDLITSLEICAILFRKEEINRVIQLIQIERTDKLFNGMEMLELVLPKKISRTLISLFDFVLDPAYTKKVFVKHDVNTFFNKILFNEQVTYNPWTKAVYMYCSWKNNNLDILKNLEKNNISDEHFIIKETRDYVLSAIK